MSRATLGALCFVVNLARIDFLLVDVELPSGGFPGSGEGAAVLPGSALSDLVRDRFALQGGTGDFP